MSLHVASPITPGAQQVQREVAGACADLQRARRSASGRAPERLAHLREHLLAAELAEVDAPLGVVVAGRDVVVARVDVADLLGAQSGRHGRHHILARRARACAGLDRRDRRRSVTSVRYVQRDQPDGVPPLALTGERTLPDVPEENYWFRRHLVVYEWIAARVGGLRVIDMACGEGYGSDVLARTAAQRRRRRRQPRGARARAPALPPRRTCASSASWSRRFAEPADAVVFLQTIEHLPDPAATAGALPRACSPRAAASSSPASRPATAIGWRASRSAPPARSRRLASRDRRARRTTRGRRPTRRGAGARRRRARVRARASCSAPPRAAGFDRRAHHAARSCSPTGSAGPTARSRRPPSPPTCRGPGASTPTAATSCCRSSTAGCSRRGCRRRSSTT